ncbi:MAG: universal stress protein [Ktedonobacterales bacterium]
MGLRSNRSALRPPRILVALDGSAAARTALPIARQIAKQFGLELDILHVTPSHVPEDVVRSRLGLDAEDQQGGRLYLHLGNAAAGILEVVNDPATELVVLTTHGRAIEERHSLGRVAEAVVAASRSPILLVRPESEAARIDQGTISIRSMLIPLDGTPTTFAALRPATRLASRLGASVDLLYVLSASQPFPAEVGSICAPYYVDQPQHEWPGWSLAATRSLIAQAGCPSGVPVQAFLAVGEISAEILGFAALHQEDAIVLVRRSRLEPQRAHVLRAVLAHAPCPVLLLGVPSAPSAS